MLTCGTLSYGNGCRFLSIHKSHKLKIESWENKANQLLLSRSAFKLKNQVASHGCVLSLT